VGNLYYVFDILQKDGKDVRRSPMHERIKLLRSLDLPDWCRPVPRGKSMGEFLEAVIRDGGTGIVLKNLLEPYGKASWIKVERPMVQEAVITALDETALSARIARFQRGQLVDCGMTFLGSLTVEAQIGQVIDVDMRGCTPGSRAGRPRFVRFRADRILLDADASGRQACQPGKMIRLQSHTHSPTTTQPVNHTL
jgi:ATP-dependent DNA ligase